MVAEAAQRKGLGPEIENGLVAEGFAKGLGGNEIAPLHHVLRDRRVQAFVGIKQRDPQRQRVGEQHQGHCCQKGRQLPRLPGNHCAHVKQSPCGDIVSQAGPGQIAGRRWHPAASFPILGARPVGQAPPCLTSMRVRMSGTGVPDLRK